jgi:hypothetical protein
MYNNSTLAIVSVSDPNRGTKSAYTKDTLGPNQLDKLICDFTSTVALRISLEVPKVTDMSLRVRRSSVGL